VKNALGRPEAPGVRARARRPSPAFAATAALASTHPGMIRAHCVWRGAAADRLRQTAAPLLIGRLVSHLWRGFNGGSRRRKRSAAV